MMPQHEQDADVAALRAPDLGAAVAVDRPAPWAFGGDQLRVQVCEWGLNRAFGSDKVNPWRGQAW